MKRWRSIIYAAIGIGLSRWLGPHRAWRKAGAAQLRLLRARPLRFALYACVPLALFLAGLEAAARLFWPDPVAQETLEKPYIQYDAQLGWRHIPRLQTRTQLVGLQYSLEVTINAEGCRDTLDYPTSKPSADSYRVIALGDSFTFGHGVATPQSWPALARRLFPQLDVLNFGVPGYGLDQMALLYELRASAFEADHVVIAFIPDDLRRVYLDHWQSGYFRPQFRLDKNGEASLARERAPRPVEAGDPIVASQADGFVLRHSRLARLVRDRWRLLEFHRDRYALPAAILRRFFGAVRANGVKAVTVVFLPDLWALRGDPERQQAAQVLQKECEKAGAAFLDLLPAFEDATGGDEKTFAQYFGPGGHYSPAGCAFVARLIAEHLLEQARRSGFVPRPAENPKPSIPQLSPANAESGSGP